MRPEISEEDRRLTVESMLRARVASYGGEIIVYGERMEQMVRDLADQAEDLARQGLLPAVDERWR